MAGRSRVPSTTLWDALDGLTGGKLAEILAYERRQGTSDRKMALMIAEQYGVPISTPTIGAWCRVLNLPPPAKIKAKPKSNVPEARPLPPFPELEETP